MNFTHDPTEAIEGALWSYRGGWLTLRDVKGLKTGVAPVPIPGDIVVHRSAIAFMQVIP